MTTAHSPLPRLRQQADRIAKTLKQIERGEPVANDPGGKIAASRSGPTVTFGVAMDDKFIKIEMPWALIRAMDERALSSLVVKHMQRKRDR